MKTKGQILNGEISKILIRQKSEEDIELDELLVCEHANKKYILQVYGLNYGSQLSQSNIELLSGYDLENIGDLEFYDNNIRNYIIAIAKQVLSVVSDENKDMTYLPKTLPPFFNKVRSITKQDVKFLTKPDKSIYLGQLRSGSKLLDVPIYLDAHKVLTHHILIPATTGRGKSNLCSVLIWDLVDKDYSSLLVFDPHDEYFGRGKKGYGLKDHPTKEKVMYYSKSRFERSKDLYINIDLIKPMHFTGIINLTDAQQETMYLFYKNWGKKWIRTLLLFDDNEAESINTFKATISVLKRKLMNALDISVHNNELLCKGIFQEQYGINTIENIIQELEQSKTLIIDTSNISSSSELIISTMITTEIFEKYKYYKKTGEIYNKPNISIILEEAPRVLGKDVLDKGNNIFATLAREGRKFKVGLIGITQLPSLIPKTILANMNTKIILGIEMKPERDSIIESSAQDLSNYSSNIASLDKGEALITSNFARFALPIKIPLFDNFAKEYVKKYEQEKSNQINNPTNNNFEGVNLG